MADDFDFTNAANAAAPFGPTGPDDFSQVTNESWLGRLGGAIFGLLLAFVLIPGAVVLLSWNEHREVETARGLNEGATAVRDVAANHIDPINRLHLIHVTGPFVVPGALTDPAYDVTVSGAARLVRHVEMYQWKETKKEQTRTKFGGGTETVTNYHYQQGWSADVQDSSQFARPQGHENKPFTTRDNSVVAERGKVGVFRVDKAVLQHVEPLTQVTPHARAAGESVVDDVLYVGENPATPTIGDMRIHFSAARPDTLSLIAAQDHGALIAYTTHNNQSLLIVRAGEVTASAMFRQEQDSNQRSTWIWRGVGAAVMFVGFLLLMGPLSVVASVVPIFGEIVATGTAIVAVMLTGIFTPTVIAIAWFVVRPLLAGGLLASAAIGTVLLITLSRRRHAVRNGAAKASVLSRTPM